MPTVLATAWALSMRHLDLTDGRAAILRTIMQEYLAAAFFFIKATPVERARGKRGYISSPRAYT